MLRSGANLTYAAHPCRLTSIRPAILHDRGGTPHWIGDASPADPLLATVVWPPGDHLDSPGVRLGSG
jgi:hypothetical protein